MAVNVRIWAAAVASVILAAPAWATFSVTVDGSLSEASTWPARPRPVPIVNPTSFTLSNRSSAFEATPFYVEESGSYRISTLFGIPPASFDGVLLLYKDSFNPIEPLVGVVFGRDFGNPETINFGLVPDTQYFAVATSFDFPPRDPVPYRHTISGPGAITIGLLPTDEPIMPPVPEPVMPAVPEPASWAMLIAGFGLIGAIQRRRRPVRA
jgi:hypothetical protein